MYSLCVCKSRQRFEFHLIGLFLDHSSFLFRAFSVGNMWFSVYFSYSSISGRREFNSIHSIRHHGFSISTELISFGRIRMRVWMSIFTFRHFGAFFNSLRTQMHLFWQWIVRVFDGRFGCFASATNIKRIYTMCNTLNKLNLLHPVLNCCYVFYK